MTARSLSEANLPLFAPKRALGDVPRERRCLRCSTSFPSEGFGERICRKCKGLKAWRNAVPDRSAASRR
ncbi:MAG: hypothetical protein EP318_13085 [Rhodobacteraceae bacterium]|nr:MAG: hypothetical protein EP318_13085 [Paracoccaceae bacterium]